MTPAPKWNFPRDNFLNGFGLVILFHLAQLPLAFLTMLISLSVFGLVQLLYVVPLAIKANKLGEKSRLQGILVAAGLTILVNGMCDVSFFKNFKGG